MEVVIGESDTIFGRKLGENVLLMEIRHKLTTPRLLQGNMTPDTTLEVGEKAPTFSVEDSSGMIHDSEEYCRQEKTIILYFYPKDNTPGCTIQACDFRDSLKRLESANIIVLGVSKDSAKSHDKFIDKYNLNFPLILDEDLSLHKAFGTWRLKKNYGKEYMGCARSTFVINSKGIIQHALYNVKATGHVDRVLNLLNQSE